MIVEITVQLDYLPEVVFITHHKTGQPPLMLRLANGFLVKDGGHTVDFVVCGHDAANPGSFHDGAKSLPVVFPHVPPIDAGGAAASVRLIVVGEEMLQRGGSFQVERMAALQPFNVCSCHSAGQERIFAVAFFRAAPAGIPFQIHRGSEEDQPPCLAFLVKVGAGFVRNRTADSPHQIRIPGAGQTQSLREDCGWAAVSVHQAVGSLTSDMKRLDSQPLDSCLPGWNQRHFLFHRQSPNQIVEPCFQVQFRILKRQIDAQGQYPISIPLF